MSLPPPLTNSSQDAEQQPVDEYKLPLEGFSGTPQEKDRQWLEQCYRGDSQAQLTVRAVLMGGVLGMFTAVANLYATLKIGWAFGASISACVISFIVWNTICKIFNGVSQMSILENNCMQSTAAAAGTSTGSTLATALGALLLLTGVQQPWYVAASFVFLTAVLGVFLAIPMKRQMINHEQLRFPSGVCTAETLRSLYSRSGESLRQAYSLIVMLFVGAGVGILRNYRQLVEELAAVKRLPQWLSDMSLRLYLHDTIPFTGWLNPLKNNNMAGLAFEPSVLLVGAGMITGLRVSASMFAGSLILYYGVCPWLLAHDIANAGVVDYVRSFDYGADGSFKPVRWALWGGTAIMVVSSLTQMAINWRSVAQAFMLFKKEERDSIHDAVEAVEVPNSWLFIGLIPATIGLVVVQYFAFHVAVWLGLLSVAFSFVVSLVACRATGETDTTPTGAMGKVTQLLYSVLPGAQGVASINLMAAGTTAGAATAAADLLTDLKSGYLLGANPRRQFIAQFCGTIFGVLAVIPAWYLMVPDKKALEVFNPPATNMWKAVADLLTQGAGSLPKTAVMAIVIGSLVGMALPVIEKLWPKAQRYLPSAMGLGLAWVVPFQNTLSFVIGASIVAIWKKCNQKNCDGYSIPIASGLVAGESLVAAFIAISCTVIGYLAKHYGW